MNLSKVPESSFGRAITFALALAGTGLTQCEGTQNHQEQINNCEFAVTLVIRKQISLSGVGDNCELVPDPTAQEQCREDIEALKKLSAESCMRALNKMQNISCEVRETTSERKTETSSAIPQDYRILCQTIDRGVTQKDEDSPVFKVEE